MNRAVWREVRFSLYAAFILNGILVQWVVPLTFRCSVTDDSCPACGLRTAVDLLLQGQFSAAYRSNHLIVLVPAIGVLMAADVGRYLLRQRRSRRTAGGETPEADRSGSR